MERSQLGTKDLCPKTKAKAAPKKRNSKPKAKCAPKRKAKAKSVAKKVQKKAEKSKTGRELKVQEKNKKSKSGRELKTDYRNVYSRVYHSEIKKGTSLDKARISNFLSHIKKKTFAYLCGCRLANLPVKLHMQQIKSEVTILLNRSNR